MSEDTVTIEIPEPRYTLLDGKRDELPEVLVVNGALRDLEHPEIFAWHLEVIIEASDLAEQRMPTPAESKVLNALGDEIEEALVGYNAIFLARSTWNGFRELVYRVYDPEVANATLQAMTEGENARPWQFEMRHDPEWSEANWFLQLVPAASRHEA